jgi:hypothetical protein
MRPSIDHSLLSPSGKMSGRARSAAIEKARKELFPDGYWGKSEKAEEEKLADKKKQMLKQAQTLIDLANRGMNTKKYKREAERLIFKAGQL